MSIHKWKCGIKERSTDQMSPSLSFIFQRFISSCIYLFMDWTKLTKLWVSWREFPKSKKKFQELKKIKVKQLKSADL